MRRTLQWIYWLMGAACILYFFMIGLYARFGLSLSYIWLAGGAVFLLAGALCTRRIPTWLRAAWRTVLCLGLMFILVLEGFVVSGMNSKAPEGLDYLIVLGARVEEDGPSPALRRRLNAALAYLEENPETVVIASGGQGADEPVSEAACIRDELVAAGIAPEQILLEDQSTRTSENLIFSMEMMDSPEASVGLVTNNFHVFRAVKLAQKAGLLNVHGVAAEYTGYTLFHYMIREAAGLVSDFCMGNL